jgi:hypothetical protein
MLSLKKVGDLQQRQMRRRNTTQIRVDMMQLSARLILAQHRISVAYSSQLIKKKKEKHQEKKKKSRANGTPGSDYVLISFNRSTSRSLQISCGQVSFHFLSLICEVKEPESTCWLLMTCQGNSGKKTPACKL